MASAAKRAVDQSLEADRRCAELTELALRAAEQAASVRHLAASLTETAASVARLALDVCRYQSYQQAFEATSSASQRPPPIDVDTFLSVVDRVELATETAAQHGAGGGLRTCTEVDEMMPSRKHEGRADISNDLEQSRHHDESTSTDEVAQLTTGECHDVDVRDECPSSSFHSVSVPVMYVSSQHRVHLVFVHYQ